MQDDIKNKMFVFQTPQSVEDCLQSTLSSLYPPFEVTAPTLLTQVFSLLERTYREDPLRYTLEFLIPAKKILQTVQHQACVSVLYNNAPYVFFDHCFCFIISCAYSLCSSLNTVDFSFSTKAGHSALVRRSSFSCHLFHGTF